MFGKKKQFSPGPVSHIVVGLGNPGKQYEYTRHNAGFLCMDRLAEELNVKMDRIKFKSLCATAKIGEAGLLLLKPSTFMNNSGEAVVEAMQFYKIPPERVIVIFDDISLPRSSAHSQKRLGRRT